MIKAIKKLSIILFFLASTTFGSSSLEILLIERISQFINWPNLEDSFVIGVYQNEALKDEMIENYQGKTIQKLPIEILNIKNGKDENLSKINLLYFTKELTPQIETTLKNLDKKPVLMITEFPNDLYNGMHIGFYYENQRIKFIINQEELESKELKASYKLLKLARIVKAGQ